MRITGMYASSHIERQHSAYQNNGHLYGIFLPAKAMSCMSFVNTYKSCAIVWGLHELFINALYYKSD